MRGGYHLPSCSSGSGPRVDRIQVKGNVVRFTDVADDDEGIGLSSGEQREERFERGRPQNVSTDIGGPG